MNSVGPTRNTKTASTSARTMLTLDSISTPREMPLTAERMKQMVSTTMMMTRRLAPALSTQPLNSMPAPICSAPRPSEAAEPKSVAKIASMSMTLPHGPLARDPISGSNAALISCSRPLR